MGDKFDIYPLTITKDRYSGVYSGGEWTAWNCDADEVPSDISDDDVTCCGFWSMARDAKPAKMGIYIEPNTPIALFTVLIPMIAGDDNDPIPMFGVGNSIESAVEDLNKRLLGVETC